MGEAPKGPPVPRPRGEIVAVVATSEDESDNFQPGKHDGKSKSSAPMATAKPSSPEIASDSDEGSESDDNKSSVTTLTTVTGTTVAGMDSTESSEEEEIERASSRANVAKLADPQGKLSFSGSGSKASSMGNHGSTSLVHLMGQGQVQQQQQQQPKKTKGKGARIGNGELDYTDDESLRSQDEAVKKSKRTSIRALSLHRAKIAKDYTTSESEDEVPDARHSSTVQHLQPIKSSSGTFTGHTVEKKDDGNSSTDTDTDTRTTDTSDTDDDDEEEDDEKEAKPRRIHSRKALIHNLPPPKVKFAEEEDLIQAESPGRDYSRSDVDSHDAELWEEEDPDEDHDDRHTRRMKRRNQGNSASFSGAVSRNFRWSNVKTKIFYSFRAKGGEDEEGSRVICVKNLAPAVNEQILLEFFGGLGSGVVAIVNIPKDEFGRCSGPAYVEFESGAAARKALQKAGTKLLERVVFVDLAHETSTSRHVEQTKPSVSKPAEPQGIDKHSIFNRNRHVRTKSHDKLTESLQIPKGYPLATSSGDKSGGNEGSRSDPEESTRGAKTALGGFRLKLFGSSKSGNNSEKERERPGSQNQSRGIETQSRGIEVHTRGIEFQPRGFDARQSFPSSPGAGAVVDEEAPIVGSLPLPHLPKVHNKTRKWSWGKWRRKHRWAKLWWPWVKKPRWHWWQFANLSARWGKARQPSVKTTEEVNSKGPRPKLPPSPPRLLV